MDTATVEAIKTALVPVAEKIGQGAQFGWEVVMKQQYAEGLAGTVLGSLAVLVFTVIYFFVWKNALERDKYGDYDGDMLGAGVMTTILSMILFIPICFWLYTSILHLINPAYYALDFFIHLVK